MPSENLTVRGVARLKPGARCEIWDKTEPGLFVRVGRKRIVYGVRCNVGGRRIRETLGATKDLTLDEARTKASEIRASSQRSGPRPVEIRTFADLAEQYLERSAKQRKRTAHEDARIIRNELIPAFGFKLIERVEKRDVLLLIESIFMRGAPIMSNRVRSKAYTVFQWGRSMDLCKFNPVDGLRVFGQERRRQRVLADREVRSLWAAVEGHPSPLADAIKLLLLTGQRRNEVCGMRWSEIDLDVAMWTLPPERVKNGNGHHVPLSPAVVDILERIRDRQFDDEQRRARRRRREPCEHEYVFPNRRNPSLPVTDIKSIKADIEKAAGITTRWTLHDLRRTVATRLADIHTPQQVIEKLLNHAPVGVTARHYVHSTFETEKREALELWARRLNVIVSGLAAVQVEAGS